MLQAAPKASGKKIKRDPAKNPMRDLHIRKLCLNICVGESGDRLTRAAKVTKTDIDVCEYVNDVNKKMCFY